MSQLSRLVWIFAIVCIAPACGSDTGTPQAASGASGSGGGAIGGNGGADAAIDGSARDAATAACGSRTCAADLEYCRVQYPGAGGAIGYSCTPRNDCDRCDCLSVSGCSCGESDAGFITVTCRGM
jgi:hypothetical protein